MKIREIEEAYDIGTIKVDEIIGSFLTFVTTINDKSKKRNKCVAFKSDIENDEEHVEEDTDENLFDSIALTEKIWQCYEETW